MEGRDCFDVGELCKGSAVYRCYHTKTSVNDTTGVCFCSAESTRTGTNCTTFTIVSCLQMMMLVVLIITAGTIVKRNVTLMYKTREMGQLRLSNLSICVLVNTIGSFILCSYACLDLLDLVFKIDHDAYFNVVFNFHIISFAAAFCTLVIVVLYLISIAQSPMIDVTKYVQIALGFFYYSVCSLVLLICIDYSFVLYVMNADLDPTFEKSLQPLRIVVWTLTVLCSCCGTGLAVHCIVQRVSPENNMRSARRPSIMVETKFTPVCSEIRELVQNLHKVKRRMALLLPVILIFSLAWLKEVFAVEFREHMALTWVVTHFGMMQMIALAHGGVHHFLTSRFYKELGTMRRVTDNDTSLKSGEVTKNSRVIPSMAASSMNYDVDFNEEEG